MGTNASGLWMTTPERESRVFVLVRPRTLQQEEEEEEIEIHDVAETTDDVLFNNIHD